MALQQLGSSPSSLSFSIYPTTRTRSLFSVGDQCRVDENNSRRRSKRSTTRTQGLVVVLASSSTNPAIQSDTWKPTLPTTSGASPSLSDIIWPSAGAFAAMAISGKMDQILVSKGISSMTMAPMGAVCAILFAAPSSPAAKKYNMFIAQIGCAAIGVAALAILGPGWLARSTALAASIAFMISTGSLHPPAASLPLLFIDAAKYHHLSLWYALFPGATSCVLLCLLQEAVCYMKNNFKF